MKLKGYGELRPEGCIEIDETCVYFYYLLPDRMLVELEVIHDPAADSFTRRVTAYRAMPLVTRELQAS